MPNTPKDKDQEKGDEVLRRLLKTPPVPHDNQGKQKRELKPKKEKPAN